jgi:DNA-binding CsgD family transcriptional regulator
VGIDQFYTATLETGVEGMLAFLASRFGAAALGITTRASSGAVAQRWRGLEPAFDEAYLAHFHDRDPYLQGAARLGLRPGLCAAGRQLVDDGERAKSPLIHELFRPFGFGDLQGGILCQDETKLVSLGMMRPSDAEDFTPRDAETLQRYIPHVRNGLRIASLAHGGARAFAAATVCKRGRVLEVTGDEARLLRTLVRHCGELQPRNDALVPAFSAAVARACSAGIPSTVRATDALLLVTPSELGGARVEAHDLGAASEAAREAVREAFRLSAAEADLACAIADGDDPSCFAARRGVRISTVRTQLRSVFRKTGTTKQAELAALVTAVVRLR